MLPALHLPVFDMKLIQSAIPNAFTIAVLAAIESLLSCVVADGMINSKHRSDTELIAQVPEILLLRFSAVFRLRE